MLYIILWFFSSPESEHTLKILGRILKIIGYIQDIPKAINAFSKTNTWVFLYILENDDKENQKIKWKAIPNKKNIIYFIVKFLLIVDIASLASIIFLCFFNSIILLSDKKINLIIIVIKWEIIKAIAI